MFLLRLFERFRDICMLLNCVLTALFEKKNSIRIAQSVVTRAWRRLNKRSHSVSAGHQRESARGARLLFLRRLPSGGRVGFRFHDHPRCKARDRLRCQGGGIIARCKLLNEEGGVGD